jgi:diadenylate cyclase
MAQPCTHLAQIRDLPLTAHECEKCLKIGNQWVHLRRCLVCGHVGCCDDSRNRHASSHFRETGHAIIESLEPGEVWRWCFIDEALFVGDGDPSDEGGASSHQRDPPSSSRVRDLVALPSSAVSLNGAALNHRDQPDASGSKMFKSICRRVRKCNKEELEPTIELAVEIAREGREGRRIGTIFTFGDADGVLARSRPLILDPLAGHPEEAKRIKDANLRGTIKELAQLDGAFVVSDQGAVVSACRYLDAMASGISLPLGMGSRHLAGGFISQVTDAVAIVVSESSMVRVFDDGKLVAEIIPELWLMDHFNVQLPEPYKEERVGDLAVLTAKA